MFLKRAYVNVGQVASALPRNDAASKDVLPIILYTSIAPPSLRGVPIAIGTTKHPSDSERSVANLL